MDLIFSSNTTPEDMNMTPIYTGSLTPNMHYIHPWNIQLLPSAKYKYSIHRRTNNDQQWHQKDSVRYPGRSGWAGTRKTFTQSHYWLLYIFICPCFKHVHTNLTYVPGSCTTVIISSILSLSQLTTCEPVIYYNATHPPNHSHLSPPKCHIILFLHWPCFTAM